MPGASLDDVRKRAARTAEGGLVCLRAALPHRLPYRSEPYTLVLHLPEPGGLPSPPASSGAPSHRVRPSSTSTPPPPPLPPPPCLPDRVCQLRRLRDADGSRSPLAPLPGKLDWHSGRGGE